MLAHKIRSAYTEFVAARVACALLVLVWLPTGSLATGTQARLAVAARRINEIRSATPGDKLVGEQQLVRVVTSEADPLVRAAAFEVLASRNPDAALSISGQLLERGAPGAVQVRALDLMLAHRKEEMAQAYVSRGMDLLSARCLQQAFLKFSNPEHLQDLARRAIVCGREGAITLYLDKLLSSGDQNSIKELASHFTSRLAPSITREVSTVAIRYLGAARCTEAVPLLIDLLGGEQRPAVRSQIAISLAAIGDMRAVPALIKVLADQPTKYRNPRFIGCFPMGGTPTDPAMEAAYALGRLRCPESIAALNLAARVSDRHLADAARRALNNDTGMYPPRLRVSDYW